MKNLTLFLLLLLAVNVQAQKESIQLKNALVVGQLDKAEDRYSVEINLTELLTEAGVKAIPSLNILKMGSDASIIATDSVQQLIAAKGIDTYILVSVRGYDKKFKKTHRKDELKTALDAGNLFPIYRDEVVSVSFEFMFYRNGQFIGTDIVKCGNVSSRDTVIKRFRKSVSKRIEKKWK
ncbi:MAG: hypothetical protein E6Q38_02360 [Crocinitomicaceae bacterium]|nr:MAG: hypothetical protein E6Q38_02360 [Crocinitomicaceae bacterium]